jgi:hypothetical protein
LGEFDVERLAKQPYTSFQYLANTAIAVTRHARNMKEKCGMGVDGALANCYYCATESGLEGGEYGPGTS